MVKTKSGEEKTDVEGIQLSDGKFIFIWKRNMFNYLVLTAADGTQEYDGRMEKGVKYRNPEQWEMKGSNTYIIRNFKGMFIISKSFFIYLCKI